MKEIIKDELLEVMTTTLKEYEEKSESNEILMDEYKSESKTIYENIKRINNDYEIDIRLIRMELNKRLWNEKII